MEHDDEDFPPELFAGTGIDPSEVTTAVRRVFIASDPFGVDLGEEMSLVLSDGTEFTPYYRKVVSWETTTEAPSGMFDWSPEVSQ